MWKKPLLVLSLGLAFFARPLNSGGPEAVNSRADRWILHSSSDLSARYSGADGIAELNRKIQQGEVHLQFEGPQGYLRSVLKELNVPIESQMMVFSKTSVQAPLINPHNPRMLFFSDSVSVGWVPGGFIEFASEDPQQGTVFYTLRQEQKEKPLIVRSQMCLLCHITPVTLDIPGMFARSVITASDGTALPQLGYHFSDHRSPFEERWGGWYVTGKQVGFSHMGNVVVNNDGRTKSLIGSSTSKLNAISTNQDISACLSPYSDIVALMVFDHQIHMTNLLIRMKWAASRTVNEFGASVSHTASSSSRSSEIGLLNAADETVDYMLFIDEARLAGSIQGTSGFTEKFAGLGPTDSKGRSLRQFDLHHRLLRYPCSYMIYSPAFDSLPQPAKDAIYQRMWKVLSGQDKTGKYVRMSLADRKAIIEILRETKKGLPGYFRPIQ